MAELLGVDVYTWLTLVGAIVAAVASAYVFSWLVSKILKRTGYPDDVTRRFSNLVRYVIYIMDAALIVFYFAFSIAGALGSLVGLGVFGIAVGIVVGNVLSSLITGLPVVLDKAFSIGDEIKVGSYEGKVVRIGVRKVILETKEGDTVFVPTSYFLSFPISCKACKGKEKAKEELI
jgi:small conductance mechanosensitive channel